MSVRVHNHLILLSGMTLILYCLLLHQNAIAGDAAANESARIGSL